MSPREKVLKNSKGFSDFRIKTTKTAPYGRKEIEMAEQGRLHLTHEFLYYTNVHETSLLFDEKPIYICMYTLKNTYIHV